MFIVDSAERAHSQTLLSVVQLDVGQDLQLLFIICAKGLQSQTLQSAFYVQVALLLSTIIDEVLEEATFANVTLDCSPLLMIRCNQS